MTQILGSGDPLNVKTPLQVDSRMKFEEVDEALKQCTVREAQREVPGVLSDPKWCEMVPLKGVEGDALFFLRNSNTNTHFCRGYMGLQ